MSKVILKLNEDQYLIADLNDIFVERGFVYCKFIDNQNRVDLMCLYNQTYRNNKCTLTPEEFLCIIREQYHTELENTNKTLQPYSSIVIDISKIINDNSFIIPTGVSVLERHNLELGQLIIYNHKMYIVVGANSFEHLVWMKKYNYQQNKSVDCGCEHLDPFSKNYKKLKYIGNLKKYTADEDENNYYIVNGKITIINDLNIGDVYFNIDEKMFWVLEEIFDDKVRMNSLHGNRSSYKHVYLYEITNEFVFLKNMNFKQFNEILSDVEEISRNPNLLMFIEKKHLMLYIPQEMDWEDDEFIYIKLFSNYKFNRTEYSFTKPNMNLLFENFYIFKNNGRL